MESDRRGITGSEASRLTVCVIGAGNVATHLAPALSRVANVVQVCSTHYESAARLCSCIEGCQPITDLTELRNDADFYIIAANDDAIAAIAKATPDNPGIWAHTSGSVPMTVFDGNKTNFGVFYPLQTFSRDVTVDFSRIPMFIEGSSETAALRLAELANKIAGRVEFADSNKRKALHIAAVFACNFANQMWADADRLLHNEGLSIDFLMPLLEATLNKLKSVSPEEAMTGPARRGDTKIIDAHTAMLPQDLQPTYRLLSERILHHYHPQQPAGDNGNDHKEKPSVDKH